MWLSVNSFAAHASSGTTMHYLGSFHTSIMHFMKSAFFCTCDTLAHIDMWNVCEAPAHISYIFVA